MPRQEADCRVLTGKRSAARSGATPPLHRGSRWVGRCWPRTAMLLSPGERHARWPVVDDHAADRTGYLIDDLARVWVVLIVHDHTRGEGARQLEQRGSKISSVVVSATRASRSETFLEKAAADPQGTDGYRRTVAFTDQPASAPGTDRTTSAPASISSVRPPLKAFAIPCVSITGCGCAATRASPTRSAARHPRGAKSRPGFVQNCPPPRVNEPTNPAATVAMSLAAPRVTMTGLTVAISA